MAGCESFCTKAECSELKEQIRAIWNVLEGLSSVFCFKDDCEKLWGQVAAIDNKVNMTLLRLNTHIESKAPDAHSACSEEECTKIDRKAEEAKAIALLAKDLIEVHSTQPLSGAHEFDCDVGVDVSLAASKESSSLAIYTSVSVCGVTGSDREEITISSNEPNLDDYCTKKECEDLKTLIGINNLRIGDLQISQSAQQEDIDNLKEKTEKNDQDTTDITNGNIPIPIYYGDGSLVGDTKNFPRFIGGGGSMDLNDLMDKLKEIQSEVSQCCNGISSVGDAVSTVGDSVSSVDNNLQQSAQVLGAQMDVNQNEARSWFNININSNNQNSVDLKEVLYYLKKVDSLLNKDDSVSTGGCALDSGTGIRVFNPTSNNYQISNINDYLKTIFIYLKEIHKTACESSTGQKADVEKIWRLLGGDSIFTANPDGTIQEKILNLEKDMRKDINNMFYPSAPDAIKGDRLIKHLPDYLRAIGSVEHFRSGHDRYPFDMVEDWTLSLEQTKEKLGITDVNWSWDKITSEQEKALEIEIESDLDWNIWRQKNDYDVYGKFPFQITIEKNSLIKQDIDIAESKVSDDPILYKYTTTIVDAENDEIIDFSSISDSFSEIYGFLLAEAINNKLVKELNSRQMFEVASIRQMVTDLYGKIESIQAYLGYKISEKSEEYWLTFNPSPKEVNEEGDQTVEMLDFLKPSKVYYTKEQFAGKSTESLEAKIFDLLTSSAIIKNVHADQIKNSTDISIFKGNLKNKLKQGKDLYETLLGDPKTNDDSSNPDKTEFDKWLEEGVEKGFSKQIGDIDADGNIKEPYGRDYEARPKVQRFKGSPVMKAEDSINGGIQ